MSVLYTRSISPGGVPQKGVNKANKDFFPNLSENVRVLKLRFSAFVEGPGGFREVREAGRNHFQLSWYLLVPGLTSYDRFSLNGTCQRGGYTSCRFSVVKNTLKSSKILRPKRSLNARLGHCKVLRLSLIHI